MGANPAETPEIFPPGKGLTSWPETRQRRVFWSRTGRVQVVPPDLPSDEGLKVLGEIGSSGKRNSEDMFHPRPLPIAAKFRFEEHL
jgi:hypothetical protein